ncbi:MAG: integration host factor subunit alpha [Sutterellaceae bacterium]|nr:integration host factor subunit alpha [Sutterellaceae bacterium]
MHFIELLYERLGLTRSEAGSVVDGIFEEIEKALVEGKEVKLVNFGTFTPRDKSARPGRNPRNGDEHVVSARRVITFAPSKYLRDRVADFTDPDYEADKDDEKEVA